MVLSEVGANEEDAVSGKRVVGYGAIRGEMPAGGSSRYSRSATEQVVLVKNGASSAGGAVERFAWDRYTSSTINLFNRPAFMNAIASARELDGILVVADLFKFLGLIGDKMKATHAYVQLTSHGVTIIDGKLGLDVLKIPRNALQFMIMSAVASRVARRIKKAGPPATRNEPTDRAVAAAEKARTRHADEFARRMSPAIVSIRDELGNSASHAAIARRLNELGHSTPRGGLIKWQATTVIRLLERLERLANASTEGS